MKTNTNDRRQFLKSSGATAILAAAQPQRLLAADDPMSMAAFENQDWQWFHFYDDSGHHQANLFLWGVYDQPVSADLEQFSLRFVSLLSEGPALPDGVYNVTTPDGDVVVLNTERRPSRWSSVARYVAVFCLLQKRRQKRRSIR